MRRCSSCGLDKPATLEFFYRKKSGVWESPCKVCHKQRGRDWALSNPGKDKEIKRRHLRTHQLENRLSSSRWDRDNVALVRLATCLRAQKLRRNL